MRGQHDRALVVAGVTDQAMIEDFATAIIAATETCDRRAFATTFDSLVEKYGWSCNGGREWRIATIFETSIRTSYMAGRLKQMRDPDVVKLMPYWMYRHADTRVPKSPRLRHLAWDGLVLDWDDPWWDVHYPPNDWMCSCGVHALSRGDLKRLDKTGPDIAPAIVRRPYTHEASGETVMQPDGVGFGWDYLPGKDWVRPYSRTMIEAEALPQTLADPLMLIDRTQAVPMAEMQALARPFTATVMPPNLPLEEYARAFLGEFGLDLGETAIWDDITGARLLISDDLFRERSGAWKDIKRGHGDHALLLAEALRDPDEIWVALRAVPDPERPGAFIYHLVRRYIRVDPERPVFALFELGRRIWFPLTGYGPLDRGQPDFACLDRQRSGLLIWQRG